MKMCPCKDCPNSGCGSFHDQCEQYQGWLKQKHIIDEQIRKEKELKGKFHKKPKKWYE